jgi:hypothetical protein
MLQGTACGLDCNLDILRSGRIHRSYLGLVPGRKSVGIAHVCIAPNSRGIDAGDLVARLRLEELVVDEQT